MFGCFPFTECLHAPENLENNFFFSGCKGKKKLLQRADNLCPCKIKKMYLELKGILDYLTLLYWFDEVEIFHQL